MLELANRVDALKPSATLAISAKAAELKGQGHDVISLAAGEPDFPTPEPIVEAGIKAMRDGITRYTPSAGFLALREAICEQVLRDNKLELSPANMVATVGAKDALFLTLQCLINPGDAVLVPTPAWVSYGPMINLAGGELIPLPLQESDHYRINVDQWKGLAIPSNAKGIILNSPNNPTGASYTKEELTKLVGWAMQRGLWIISDEIYDKILYDGATHTSVASLGPEVAANTITVGGFSKSYCMTGWRLGWVAGPNPLIKKITAMQSQSTSHPTSFVQYAGIAASKLDPSIVQNMVVAFDRRRKLCCERLDKLSKYVTYARPTGAFYIFVNAGAWTREKGISDVELCQDILTNQYVGLVPGSAFGKENCLRLSYATSDENLTEAFDRLDQYFS